jgi:two-component system OmpR family response regulator
MQVLNFLPQTEPHPEQSGHSWPDRGTGARGRILIVSDDTEFRRTLANYLEGQDMRVLSADGRQAMWRHFSIREPSLLLLDLELDKDDGLDLLREVRSRSELPIIVITEHDRDEADRVVGLALGADACVSRVIGLRELLARMRAVLRRQDYDRAVSRHDPASGGFRFEGWHLNLHTRRLLNPEETEVALTKSEYALLVAFLDAPGRPLTREHLLHATRIREDVFDRSIDVQVLRLRRKLEYDMSAPRFIQTERGVGYSFGPKAERWY